MKRNFLTNTARKFKFERQTKIPMREIKVLYSRKHGTIEASKFKCGSHGHRARVVATFYDVETADKFIARALDRWDFSNPNELPSNDDIKFDWGRFECNLLDIS